MTDRTHVEQGLAIFDAQETRINELNAIVDEKDKRIDALEQRVAYECGRNEQLDAINRKLQSTMSTRETALALFEAAKRTNDAVPMPPQQPQLPLPALDAVTEDLAKRLAPPMREMRIPHKPLTADAKLRVAS